MSDRLTKRQFRTEVFKGVFLREFYDDTDLIAQLDDMYNADTHLGEIGIPLEEAPLIIDKCKAVVEAVPKLDEIISANLTKWTINRIGKVELTLLRLAIYEYLYDNLDEAIVINEAVDLAKIYSGDKAGSFVNGVMAGVVAISDKSAWL